MYYAYAICRNLIILNCSALMIIYLLSLQQITFVSDGTWLLSSCTVVFAECA